MVGMLVFPKLQRWVGLTCGLFLLLSIVVSMFLTVFDSPVYQMGQKAWSKSFITTAQLYREKLTYHVYSISRFFRKKHRGPSLDQ
jgi:hypothetical protein